MINIKKILSIGIWNTIRLNYQYFGIRGIIHGYILVARRTVIVTKGILHYEGTPHFGCIQIGFHSVGIADYKYERSIWRNQGNIFVKGRMFLGSGTRIDNSGILYLGANLFISSNSSIECTKKIVIGDDCLMSWDCIVMDSDFHKIYNRQDHVLLNPPGEIVIGNHVWIGCRCVILKNSVIRDGAVIAAGSLLASSDISENSIVCSNGKVIRENIIWEN